MKSAAALNPTRGKPEAPSFRHVITDLWRAVSTDLFDTYRPEKHYMRGPGPKWRERHARREVIEPGTIGLDEVYSAI